MDPNVGEDHKKMHPVRKINADGSAASEQLMLPQETGVTLSVNGKAWLVFQCTPGHLTELAQGFLFNEGIIQSLEEVKSCRVCENGMVDVWLARAVNPPEVWGRTSGCSGGKTTLTGSQTLQSLRALTAPIPLDVFGNLSRLHEAQSVYRQTHGLHCSILTADGHLLAAVEDIGRHNTLDKLAGLLLQIPQKPPNLVITTTGRVSSEMLYKAARMGVRFVITLTSPTSQSVSLAGQAGITLIGYARKTHYTIYTHPENMEVPAGPQ